MKVCTVTLKSVSPLTMGRFHETPKLEREGADAYEARTWREKLHVSDEGNVIISPMMIKNCLQDTARFLGMQIPGKGKSTYTKHFMSGVLVSDPIVLNMKKEDAEPMWMLVRVNKNTQGGGRVKRCFPIIKDWQGEATIYVLDETITESVLRKHIEEAGKFIGIGSLRVANGGLFGRFQLVKMVWKNA